jgi:GntR family transcriptional repressor for pyruvate dehydrogenase complex
MFPRMSNPSGLTDRVAGALLEKIGEGAFSPGARLPSENALAQQFGVSRTVLREAISRLKHEGVVEGRQGSGVYVTQQAGVKPLRIEIGAVESMESVLQIMELRRAIEAEAAAQAALRRTDAQWMEIEGALKRIDDDVAAGKDGVEADLAFHLKIAQASGNPFVTKTLEFWSQYLESASRVTRANDARRADFSRQLREEHAAIAVAIHNRDPFAARNAAEAHMFNGARRLSEVMAAAAPVEDARMLQPRVSRKQ